MKKILFVFAFILLSFGSYGQTKIIKTTELTIGFKEGNKFDWQKSSPQVLKIKIKKKMVIIFSSEVQKFKVVYYDGAYQNGVKRFYCQDKGGLACYLYISNENPETGIISVGVEYDNIAYYYTGKLK